MKERFKFVAQCSSYTRSSSHFSSCLVSTYPCSISTLLQMSLLFFSPVWSWFSPFHSIFFFYLSPLFFFVSIVLSFSSLFVIYSLLSYSFFSLAFLLLPTTVSFLFCYSFLSLIDAANHRTPPLTKTHQTGSSKS